MEVSCLGTAYTIRRVDAGQDAYMDKNGFAGYCDSVTREIVILNLRSLEAYKGDPEKRLAAQEKETLRHEIVHAFLNESGLQESSLKYEGGWAHNEEMVDWIARQEPKLHAAFEAAGAL